MTNKMNWNLNKNKCLSISFAFFLVVLKVNGQSKQDFELGLSVAPAVNFCQLKGTEWESYTNSSKSSVSNHMGLQAHAWIKKSIGKNSDVQIGLGYANLGFERIQQNLQLSDKTYPGIGSGVIPDVSSMEKKITYTYHFRNFQIPIIWNSLVGHSKDFRIKFYASAGAVLNTLLSHSLVAETAQGYLIDSQSKFQLDSSGFNPNRISLAFQLGLKGVYKLDKNKSLFVQPLIGYFPFSITSSSTSVNPILLQVNIGLMLPFERK